MCPILKRNSKSIEKIINKHGTVNHSKHFKDPIAKIHTSNIESLWNAVKQGIPIKNRNKKFIYLHLKEYQWRRRYKENNIWKEFLKD
jgi:hypothetical protein